MSDVSAPALDKKAAWLKLAFDIDVSKYPEAAAAPGGAPGGSPGGAPGGPAAKGTKKPDAGKPEERFDGHQTNPFDAPEVLIEIEKLTLPKVQHLASEQAQNAARDFMTALENVRKKKAAEAAAEDAKKELMMTIIISIALLPLGPVVEAAAAGMAGPGMRQKLGEFIADSAPAIEKKFGAAGTKAADKAFNFVASEKVAQLAEKFDAAKAKSVLEKGQDKLKDVAIKFMASSDKGKAVDSYLSAVQKSANSSMHNLTDLIGTTTSLSEAVAFYNLFSNRNLQGVYEATLTQQVDDMLSQLNDALAQHGTDQVLPTMSESSTAMALDEIVSIAFRGRKPLAHVTKLTNITTFKTFTSYVFRKWVTPDMQATAQRMVKENLTMEDFKHSHIPDPVFEPGERIVWVKDGNKDRLMLISIEDVSHVFVADEYGVCTFKQWAESEEDVLAFTSRGAMQNGGANHLARGLIKGIK